MRHALYLRFYALVKNEALALLLTRLAYLLVRARYFVKKWCSKKRIVNLDVTEARERVEAVEKCPVSRFEIQNKPVDPKTDLSVIIPVYNYESVLDEMIQSVLNQKTGYRYEVILVDDGSREPAKEILRKYEDYENVTVIYQQNQGISGARNTGLNFAKGKYVMFVDCDDVVHDNIVQTLVQEAENSGADLVMGGHALVKQEKGVEISRRDNIYPQGNLEGYRDGDSIMNYPGLPWCKVYHRSLFEKVRFPVNFWYEDTVVHFLLFRLAKHFVYVPKVLYDYRWYEGNFSKVQSQSNVRVLEHYWIVEYMLHECRRVGLKPDPVEYKVLLRHLGSYLYNAIAHLPEEVKLAAFCLACNLAEENRVEMPKGMNLQLRELEKAFLHRNYNGWKQASTLL